MIILSGTGSGISSVSQAVQEAHITKFLYLGGGDAALLQWAKNLSGIAGKINAEGELQQIAEQIRGPFLDVIRSLNEQYSADALWHISRISEQNTMHTEVFIDCCRLMLARQVIVEKNQHDLLVLVDSSVMADTLARMLERHRIPYSRALVRKDLFRTVSGILALVRDSLLVVHLYHNLIGEAKKYQTPRPDPVTPENRKRKTVLIHSYLNRSSCREDGTFQDPVFGSLIPFLENKNYDLYFLPTFLDIGPDDAPAVFRCLSENKRTFLNPFCFFDRRDLVSLVLSIWYVRRLPEIPVFFDDTDISPLVKEYQTKLAVSSSLACLYRVLPEKLHRKGYHFDYFMDVFEGMVLEKALLPGLREHYPGIQSRGFSHVVTSKFVLSYFTHTTGSGARLLPDSIICTGPVFRKFLISEGFDPTMISTGCALRQEYLFPVKKEAGDKRTHLAKNGILVPLPLVLHNAQNILEKLSDAFLQFDKKPFFVKPHPAMPARQVELLVERYRTCPNVSVVKGPLENWLKQAEIVISEGSSSLVEAFAAGIPVMIIGSETVLNLNPLDWIDTPVSGLYIARGDISRRIRELLELSDAGKEAIRNEGERFMAALYCPVTPERMEVFIHD